MQAQKVTGFADSTGALSVSVDASLHRRNDGALSGGAPRWAPSSLSPPVTPDRPALGIRPVLEFSPVPALRSMLAASGTPVPAGGPGSGGVTNIVG